MHERIRETRTSSEVFSTSARLFAHAQSPAAPSPPRAAHTSSTSASSSFLGSFSSLRSFLGFVGFALSSQLSVSQWGRSAVGDGGEGDWAAEGAGEDECCEERSVSSSRTGSSCASDGGCNWMIGLQTYFGFAGASSADCFRFTPLQTAIRELYGYTYFTDKNSTNY